MYLADFNEEQAFSEHVDSLIEFAKTHCGEPDKLDSLIEIIDGSAFDDGMFAITVLPEPDLTKKDPRKAAIEEWANNLCAIITMPTGIYAPDFSPILAKPDATAPWWKLW